MYTNLVTVIPGDRNSLLEALSIIGDFDNDFIGENGPDYLWDEAKRFESNCDYLLHLVKDIPDDNEAVQVFIETWMKHDSNYYAEYGFDTITDENNNVIVISFATYN